MLNVAKQMQQHAITSVLRSELTPFQHYVEALLSAHGTVRHRDSTHLVFPLPQNPAIPLRHLHLFDNGTLMLTGDKNINERAVILVNQVNKNKYTEWRCLGTGQAALFSTNCRGN